MGYADLANTGVVVNCLEWLMPGLRINAARIEQMQAENIQADTAAALRDARDRAGNIHNLMPADVLARLVA